MAFQVGQRVGDYEILQMLGAGGMGHVYRVRNVISNRIEAMKVLLPDLAAEPDLAVRFISEIRTLASFDHPNIALLHTAFQADNQLVMMMEFVEGFTLEHRGQQKIPGPDVVHILSQTLSALSYAHARGVVHRDIKPANIMVTSHGVAKLMDFGIAKSKVDNNLTRPGTTMGSLYYMSPEQVRGTTVEARSDLYSIGIVLYELLAGIRPFEGDTTFEVLNQQLNVQPRPPIEVNPSLPSGLNDIILTALAKDPAQRFQSADAFRNALKPFIVRPALQAGHDKTAPAIPTPPASNPSAGAPPSTSPPEPVYQPVAAPPYAPANQAHKGGNKLVWISTGAVAAVLALVTIAVAIPRYRHAQAAASEPAVSSSPEPAVATPPPAAPLVAAPATDPAPPVAVPGASVSVSPVTRASAGPHARSAAARSGSRRAQISHPAQDGSAGFTGAGTAAPNFPESAPQPAHSGAELEQLQEQLTQINARANSARRGVQQIRSQQEQMGLGMRGDVEASESRLDTYIRAANDDVRSGNAPAASRDMEKADRELAILEKFLGH